MSDDHQSALEPLEEDGSQDGTSRLLPVQLQNLDCVEGRYVNLVNVNHDRASFQVIFSQFMQPVILSPLDAERLAEQNFVTANVVARLVFTPLMMEETIKLLQFELDNYHQDLQAASGSDADG